jgi:hypothetical protein
VVDDFVEHLATSLFRRNCDRVPEDRLRLRLALDYGPVQVGPNGFVGRPVVTVSRLVGAKPVRRALATSGAASLAVILSQRVYADLVSGGHTRLPAKVFTRTQVREKELAEEAWLRVPGTDPHVLDAALSEPAPKRGPAAQRPQPQPDIAPVLSPPSAGVAFFLSYAREDREYTEQLIVHLRGFGLPVWSHDDLAWGENFALEIPRRVKSALAVIVVMSPAAGHSKWVEREVLEGQRYSHDFLPILLHGERLFLLASSMFFDARDGELPGNREVRQLQAIRDKDLAGAGEAPPIVLPRPTRPVPPAALAASVSAPAGFFPTLRNPQQERLSTWRDRWENTVMAVHLRLWERRR